jgi:hypothetical protein
MTRLVLHLVGPCLMALVVGTVGLRLGEDVPPPARRTSTTAFGKLAALGVCVQPVSGSHQEAEAVVGRVAPALDGLGQPLTRLFTVPALIDVGCPGEPAHDGAADRTRHVA